MSQAPNQASNFTLISRRRFLASSIATAAFAAGAALPVLSGCRSERGDEIIRGERKFVDDAGREHTIPTPDRLTKVYFTSLLAQVFIMTLKPEVMGATCSRFTEEDMLYLPNMHNLEYLGPVESGQMDVESVMQMGIQLIFSISSTKFVQENINEADRIEKLSGIPVILIDGSTERITDAYEKLGNILGCEQRAAELSAYCEDTLKRVRAAVNKIPEDERVSVYYAEGPQGLQTEPANSQHAWAFVEGGAKIVAEVDWFDATGMSDVSLESVIGWNPQVIFTWDADIRGGAENIIRTSPDWAVIDAVRNGRVYAMPNVPISWVDRPMACNRFLGVQWVANILYPDRYDVDMVEVAKEFYKLFYGVEVSDDAMQEILGASYPLYQDGSL